MPRPTAFFFDAQINTYIVDNRHILTPPSPIPFFITQLRHWGTAIPNGLINLEQFDKYSVINTISELQMH